MTLIPNWVDTETIRPLPRRKDFRLQLGIGDDAFLVTYAGNMGVSQGLEIVLDAAAIMNEDDHIQVLMVGSGTTRDSLEARAHDLHLANLRFLAPQPDYAVLQAATDVSLVTQRANILDVNLPSKIAAIMASGRPMLAVLNPANDAYRIVAEAGCAILIEPSRPDQLADAIRRLRSNPQLCRQLGRNGRHYALRHFSKRSAVEAYERLLETVTLPSRPSADERAGMH
jgi:colanic acid biosynthesis glycosyl transferase WcaI